MSTNKSAQYQLDVTHDVHTAQLDDATTAQLSEALIAALNDPAMKKKSYEGVKALAAKLREGRATFVKIAGGFSAFDDAKVKDNNGNVIQLGSKWQPYIKVSDVSFCKVPLVLNSCMHRCLMIRCNTASSK